MQSEARENGGVLSQHNLHTFLYMYVDISVVLPRVQREKTYKKQHVPAGLKPQTKADVITRDASLTWRPQRYS